MEEITSRSNPLAIHIRKLRDNRKYRRSAGELLCEGPKMLEEALRFGASIKTLILRADLPLPEGLPSEVRQVRVPEGLLSWLSDTEQPQGILFTCKTQQLSLPEDIAGGRFLVLDGLQDPGNVGTIWRTADALGADGLFLLPGCADPWNGKVLRATMGACFRLPLWETEQEPLLARLRALAIPLYAAGLTQEAVEIGSVPLGRAAVTIGSEGRGVSHQLLAACDGIVTIPMRARCESLNAAAAATVVLWEMSRQGKERVF